MWLQPSLKVSVSHESRLAQPRPLLSFPLTFLAWRALCCLLLNLVSNRTPRAFSVKLLSSWVALSFELLARIVFPRDLREQRFALPLIEHPNAPVSPFLWRARVPLGGNTTLWFLSHSSEVCVIRKVANSVPHHPNSWWCLTGLKPILTPPFGSWFLFSVLGKVMFDN